LGTWFDSGALQVESLCYHRETRQSNLAKLDSTKDYTRVFSDTAPGARCLPPGREVHVRLSAATAHDRRHRTGRDNQPRGSHSWKTDVVAVALAHSRRPADRRQMCRNHAYAPFRGAVVAGTHTGAPAPCSAASEYSSIRPLARFGTVQRYYDPGTGQFTSLDPLNQMTNAGYPFVKDNPFGGSDPSGTIECGRGTYCSSSGADSPRDQASANSLQPPTSSASPALPPLPSSPPPPGYDCTGDSGDCNQTGPRYSVSARQNKEFLAWAGYSSTKYCEEDLTDYPVMQFCTPQNILSNGGYYGCTVGSAGGACQIGWVGVGQERSLYLRM
jgi:hypothetical protein